MAQSVPSPSVYVGDLDLSVTEAMLYEHFKSCGPVVSVRVCLDSQTHKSLGYGYVNFQNPADAELAIEKLNSTKLASKFIRVSKIQRDPSLRKSGVNNIVVKRLPVEIDTPALKELFASFGKIISLRIAADESGKSRGYAYIQFENEEACDKAVAEVNNQQIEGQTITVERYSSQHRAQVMEQYTNLYIKNLSENVTDEQLRSVFGAYGTITSLKIRSDEIGRSMGFGYVAYSSHEEAAAAVAALNEKENPIAKDGAVLFVARFESKRERQRKREIAYRERQAQYAKYPNLYVKNFDDTVTAEQLKDIFERFGPTQSVKVQYDPVTKVSRGFGFVSYKDAGSAQKALQELPGSTILGPRPLFVAFALKKDARRMQFEEMQKKRMTRAMGPMGGFGGGFGGGLGSGMGNMYNQPPMGGPMGAFGQGPMGGFGGQGPMGGFGGQGPMGGFGGQGPMSMMPMRMMQPQQPRMQQPMLQQQQQQMMMARARPMQPKPAMVAPTHVAHHQPPQQQSLPSILASMSVEQQKNVLGERLYTYITRRHPAEAAKVTGMLLEMDNAEILNLLDSPELLDAKIQEALDVLSRHSTGNM